MFSCYLGKINASPELQFSPIIIDPITSDIIKYYDATMSISCNSVYNIHTIIHIWADNFLEDLLKIEEYF